MPCGWETRTTGICGRGVMAMKRITCGVVRLGAGVQVDVESMWRVLHNRCKHHKNLSHHSYRYGIHTGVRIQHCTPTCVTCGPKIVGLPVPMQNPMLTASYISLSAIPLTS
jgi:hypothetical protein